MSNFPEMGYKASGDLELVELGPDETSLDLLQKIYRSPRQPIARRMRAAMAALQHEHPKLTAMAVGRMNGKDFATMLDRAIQRSQGNGRNVPQLELRAEPEAADRQSSHFCLYLEVPLMLGAFTAEG
jgi:hypothetical protein